MKRLFLFLTAFAVILSGCAKFDPTELWENINDLDSRVTELEKLCREMNTNIDALQALVDALNKHDYITNV